MPARRDGRAGTVPRRMGTARRQGVSRRRRSGGLAGAGGAPGGRGTYPPGSACKGGGPVLRRAGSDDACPLRRGKNQAVYGSADVARLERRPVGSHPRVAPVSGTRRAIRPLRRGCGRCGGAGHARPASRCGCGRQVHVQGETPAARVHRPGRHVHADGRVWREAGAGPVRRMPVGRL